MESEKANLLFQISIISKEIQLLENLAESLRNDLKILLKMIDENQKYKLTVDKFDGKLSPLLLVNLVRPSINSNEGFRSINQELLLYGFNQKKVYENFYLDFENAQNTLRKLHKIVAEYLEICDKAYNKLNQNKELLLKKREYQEKESFYNGILSEIKDKLPSSSSRKRGKTGEKSKNKIKELEWGDEKQKILHILEDPKYKKGEQFTEKLANQVQKEIRVKYKIEISLGNIKKVARDAGYKRQKFQ